MFLKSLEIRGFKSFADKTELKFNSGITAVVGPNGSGKSNVSDAVRWVLGEQSARTLRGSKMEDIIFTGTEYRKPIGFAQVSLVLDNSAGELPIDFSDVRVTRRIFRSGESEYLINNSQCRLKDIITLFMDTGIGKEGYSLIGQGKIDAILNGKADDRRALLEEAVGIVKFKSRKVEAEKKLENTRDNLIRINDIVYTYEERLGPLEKEKNKALEYMDLLSSLRKKEVSLIMHNLIRLESDINEQKNKINELNNINLTYRKEYKTKREELLITKESLEQLEVSHSNDQVQYFEKKEDISKASGEIELLEERLKNIDESVKKDKLEIEQIEYKLLELNSEKNILDEEYKVNKESYETINNKILKIDNEVEILLQELENKQKEAEESKDNEFKLLRNISNIRNRKVILESKINNLEESIGLIEKNRYDIQRSLQISSENKIEIENHLKTIQNQHSDILSKMEENNFNKEKAQQKFNSTEKELSDIVGNLHRLEANKDMLQKLEKQYEGYNMSVKKIMDAVNNGKVSIDKSKCIVFGEAIKPKKGYETAIEITLGAAISNIITEDEEVAKKLISYLKINKLGRATFLPLTTIRPNEIKLDSSIKGLRGYQGMASHLVEYRGEYINAINYLLGKTIVCDNIENALNLAKKTNYRYKIVTLTGEVVNAGGALTGGSIQQKNMGIMSRKVEFEKIDATIEHVKKKKISIQDKIKTLTEELKEIELTNETIKEKIHETNLEKLDKNNNLNNVKNEIIKLQKLYKNTENETKENEDKIKVMRSELRNVTLNIDELEKEDKENSNLLKNLTEKLRKISNSIEEIRENSTEVRVKKAQIEEAVENKHKELKRNIKETEDLKLKLSSLSNYIDKNELIKKASLEKINNNKFFIKDIESNIIALEERAKFYEVEKGKFKEYLNKIEGLLESITIEISKKDDEIHKNEIVYTKQENEKNIYYSRLKDEFNTSFEKEKKIFVPIDNLEYHRQSVNRLKSKISSLGNVNVSSIEEFKELSEKHRFIVTEREDLVKAQEELLSVIDEMTSKMKVIFRQNFQILNKYFDETFKELFKGGTAKLKLADGDELEGSIEINVQPPGKKVQNINLMSGGEKVLSAIALLFGILKMKPTPFCILDEIEAALDDANVNRYAEFLKKFGKDIQFIIITHRKGTMEVADVMYGVTMEEKGVSKVVSVNLDK